MGIIDKYNEDVFNMYIKTHPNANPEKVKGLISKFTNDNIKNIPCNMSNNITHEESDTYMTDVFDWADAVNPIISGNGTFFKQHAEYLGPSVVMLETLMKNRDKAKVVMYSFGEGTIQYENSAVGQLSIKVIMNADYGGSATTMSPFFSRHIPPATTGTTRVLTTTLICCLELLTGNRDKFVNVNNINELFDMINIVLLDDNRDIIRDTYSVEEVLQHLVDMTNNLKVQDVKVLKLFLSTLDERQLTKLMLVNNIKLVLVKYLSNEIGSVSSYLKDNKIDLNNMTKDTINDAGYGKHACDVTKDNIEYISKVILDNCVYPFLPNDCEVRAINMKREIVCVTDTDSLMLHFAHYIDEFQSRVNNFRDSCLVASAIGMRIFIEHVIPRYVEYFAVNSRIEDKYYRDKFIFKNEFAFLAMTLLAKKMYTASTFVQEGNPRNIHKVSVTGLSFKKRDAAEFLEPVITKLYDKYILTSEKIDIESIYDEFYALRNKLLQDLRYHPEYYKVLSVKGIEAYTSIPAQLRGAIIWNNIVPDEEILPMDRVKVIPLSFDLLEKNKHIGNTGEILRLSLIDNVDKKKNPVICLPEYYKTIPDWIQPAIDVEFATDKLLSPFKQLFALFEVNMPETRGGMIPSRMIYI